jgi:hypothetical protein
MPWGPLFGAPGPDSGLHPSSLRRKENAYRRFLFLLRYAEPVVRFAHSSPVQITGAHQTKTPRLCLGGLCLARRGRIAGFALLRSDEKKMPIGAFFSYFATPNRPFALLTVQITLPVQITGAHQTKTPRLCLGGLCLARSTGFEPAISSVTGRHVRPLHHERKIIQLSYFSNYLQIFQPPNTSKLRTLWSRRWDCGPTTRKPPVVV